MTSEKHAAESDTHDADAKTRADGVNAGLPPTLKGTQVGIWRVITERDPAARAREDAKTSADGATEPLSWSWTRFFDQPKPTLYAFARRAKQQVEDTHVPRLATDIYLLGPWLFWVMVLSYSLSGVEDALLLTLNNRVMTLIETGLMSANPDGPAILRAVVFRVGAVAAIAVWRWYSASCEPVLKGRAKLYFQERLLRAHLAQDIATSRAASAAIDASPLNGWYALQELMGGLDVACGTLSAGALLASLVFTPALASTSPSLLAGFANGTLGANATSAAAAAGPAGGQAAGPAGAGMGNALVIVALCVTWPIVSRMLKRDFDNTEYVAHIHNKHFLRSKALYDLATSTAYKSEVVSGTMKDYIRIEHEKARALLGAYSDDYPGQAMTARSTPFADIVLNVLDDLPLIYYAFSAVVFREGGLSISGLALLHQTLGITRGALERVIMQRRTFRENLRQIRSVYADMEVREEPEEAEEEVEFPEAKEGEGIRIELRDVTFRYPSTDSDDSSNAALRNVSFTLPPSSLVVIVGANGSGKSSLVNLLTNLQRPTSGRVLFDGGDPHAGGAGASVRAVERLQRATALLTQAHSLFQAFSIAENIAVGDPDFCLACADAGAAGAAALRARVEEAARLGGALEFVGKREQGFDEVVHPVNTCWGSTYPMPPGPLKDIYDALEAWKDVSGGEEQRLAAARTFMRLMNPRTRLVVVDEPSSAMDPLGEFELFERLRAMRAGRTMVFVTHRFGHLTKYADVILCMKAGELVERGTHQELMDRGGEYSKLYAVQAQAFADAGAAADSGHATIASCSSQAEA
ncbi:hypothetical protein PsYK624_151850 [Phanerochaete sordida]|uniref:ABC transporter domain-containing protein n=1 Tax=Phanerochaete sordida TaxID=48140 RepID=A0A9P3GP24_9APHY|nr:hypothetical protein PsYK624_151850 [Phanerochaete sordida]